MSGIVLSARDIAVDRTAVASDAIEFTIDPSINVDQTKAAVTAPEDV